MGVHMSKDNINVISIEWKNFKHKNVKIVLFKYQHLIVISVYYVPLKTIIFNLLIYKHKIYFWKETFLI
jgi:hypothetical protein